MLFLNLILTSIWTLNSVGAFEPVAFTAIKASRNEQYLTYQAVVAEYNADFNTLYGVFKCTAQGLYFFTFNALTEPGRELKLTLRTNRIPVVSAYGSGASSITISASAILNLMKNDLVYIYVDKGNVYEASKPNMAFSSFSGFRISDAKPHRFFSSLMGRSHESNTFFTNITEDYFKPDEKDNILTLLNNSN